MKIVATTAADVQGSSSNSVVTTAVAHPDAAGATEMVLTLEDGPELTAAEEQFVTTAVMTAASGEQIEIFEHKLEEPTADPFEPFGRMVENSYSQWKHGPLSQ